VRVRSLSGRLVETRRFRALLLPCSVLTCSAISRLWRKMAGEAGEEDFQALVHARRAAFFEPVLSVPSASVSH
jgi:hypothetical protein